MMTDKKIFRKAALARRRGISPAERAEKSARIASRLFSLPEWREAGAVFAYMSLPDEAATEEILREALRLGKTAAIPKVCGDELIFQRITDLTDVMPGCFGVREPATESPVEPPDDPGALILLPGAAFDLSGRRMGYGRGFYDRYLRRYPGQRTAGLCFEECLYGEIPADGYDVPADLVITDGRVIRIR